MTTLNNRRGSGGRGSGGNDILVILMRQWHVVLLACVVVLALYFTTVFNNDPAETTLVAAMTYLEDSKNKEEKNVLQPNVKPNIVANKHEPYRLSEAAYIDRAFSKIIKKRDHRDSLPYDRKSGQGSPRDTLGSSDEEGNVVISNNRREHPEGLEVRRHQLIDGLVKRFGRGYCKFPEFFYKNWKYVTYNLDDAGTYIDHGWRRREKKKYLTGEYEESRDEEHDPSRLSETLLPNLNRKISYIHVGKAGGSSVSCSIREARKYGVGKHCKESRFNEPSYNETAISQQVDCYSHYNYQGMCYGEGRSYLYNVRNPIHRIKSWYLYEHFLNQPKTQTQYKRKGGKMAHCGNILLGTCYKDFDHLASVGLDGPRPPFESSKKDMLRVATNLTPDECSDWAWATTTGEVPASYHNAFNYDWYYAPMLEEKYRDSEVFVLRVEHLDKDWGVVDKMVGGDGNTLAGDVMPASMGANVNVAKDKDLPVRNSTLSVLGWKNLCKAMCHEIQTYKAMLRRAENLNDDDVRESVEELRETCPEETVDIREC